MHPVGLDKCIMTHVHHFNMQSVFTTLKIFCALPVDPHSVQSLIFLLAPFLESNILGKIQYVDFSDYLFFHQYHTALITISFTVNLEWVLAVLQFYSPIGGT